MERKSSFESRHKRKLQSDGENRRKRHKGDASNQHKLDGDIRTETTIYKLDSRNKIVLPRADETNLDNEFLQYVKARLEEKSSPNDNGNGRRHSNEKTRKHEPTRNSKRYRYDTDESMEERTYARNSTSKEPRGSRNGRHNHYTDHYDNDQRKSYAHEKRPSNGYDRNENFCSCKRYSYDTDESMEERTYARNSTSKEPRGPRTGRHNHYTDHYDNDQTKSYAYEKRPTNGYDRNEDFCSCKQRRNNSVAMPQEMDQNTAPVKRRHADDERRMSYIDDKRPSDGYDERVGSRRRTSAMAYPREQNMEPVNGQNFCELSEEQMLQCFQLVFRKLCTLQNGNGTKLEIAVATTNQAESPPVNNNGMEASSTPVENQLDVENTPTNTPGATPTTRSPRNTPPGYTLPHSQPPPQRERAQGSGMVHKAYFYPSKPKRNFTEPVETRILGKQFVVNELQIANTVGNPSENSPRQSVGGERIIEVPQQNQQYPNQVTAPTEQQQQQKYEHEPHNQLAAVDEQSSLPTMEKYPTEFNRESMLRRSTQSASAVGRQSLEDGYAQNRGSQQSGQQNSAPQPTDSGTPQHPALSQPHNTNMELLMGVNEARQQNSAPQPADAGTPQQIDISHPQDTNVEILMGVNTSNPADFTGSIGTHSYQSDPIPMTFPMAPNLNPNSFLRQETAQPNTNYPIYPYGFKNGLQKLSADSVRIIPNVTVVDYNDTCCSIPICSPVSNTSYEYILMRVKKNRPF